MSYSIQYVWIAWTILLEIQTTLALVKIISIPDEEYFFETSLGCMLEKRVKFYDVPFVFFFTMLSGRGHVQKRDARMEKNSFKRAYTLSH